MLAGDFERQGRLQSRASFFKPVFEVDVVDTRGAGAGWAAAFDYGLIRKWDLEACATVANAVGALIVTKRGATSAMPTRAELGEFLRRRDFVFEELMVSRRMHSRAR
jgi:sugar/nucleoside kinase (ribokinase family)